MLPSRHIRRRSGNERARPAHDLSVPASGVQPGQRSCRSSERKKSDTRRSRQAARVARSRTQPNRRVRPGPVSLPGVRRGLTTLLLVLAAALAAAAVPAAAGPRRADLRAGVGKADITPDTGYYLGGWTRADRVAQGQHTRLFSRALVLERGGRKVALVQRRPVHGPRRDGAADRRDARRARASPSTTSSSRPRTPTRARAGYANFPTLNTAAPSLQTVTDPMSFAACSTPEQADPQLYTFLLEQIATAIRRADDDLGPAAAGWGSSRILGLTRNRSLEAHLANHGIVSAPRRGPRRRGPRRATSTRSTRRSTCCAWTSCVRRRAQDAVRVPIGAWSHVRRPRHGHQVARSSSTTATTTPRRCACSRTRVRARRGCPRGQEVAQRLRQLQRGRHVGGPGPRRARRPRTTSGRVEAAAMFAAWRARGASSRARPALDLRWTRVCFCGQQTEGGEVGDRVAGRASRSSPAPRRSAARCSTSPGEHFEGRRAATDRGARTGARSSAPGVGGGVPNAVPLLAVRVGRRLIVSLPGEGTKEVGDAHPRRGGARRGRARGSRASCCRAWPTSSSSTSPPPRSTTASTTRAATPSSAASPRALMKQELAKLAGRAGARRAGARPRTRSTPPTASCPTARAYGDGRGVGGRSRPSPRGSYARLDRATLRLAGRAAGPRPPGRPRLRDRRSGAGQALATRTTTTWAWPCCGASTTRAATAVQWEIPRDAPARAATASWSPAKRYRLASRPSGCPAAPLVMVGRARPAGAGGRGAEATRARCAT